MNVLGTDEGTGRLLCCFDLELGGGSGGLAFRDESPDLWHRRMGHINRKSMDVLRKQAGDGVEYNGDVQACDVCPVGKSEQQAHPKQATYGCTAYFPASHRLHHGPHILSSAGWLHLRGKVR